MPKLADHGQRRRMTIEAVWQVIADQGMGAVSVRSVAAETPFSRGIVDYYFKDFEELICASARAFSDESLARAQELRNGLTGEQALRAVLRDSLPLSERQLFNARVRLGFLERAAHDARLGMEMSAGARARAAMWEQIIEEMVAQGEGDPELDPDISAGHLLAFELAMGSWGLLMTGKMSDDLADRHIDQIVRMLKANRPAH